MMHSPPTFTVVSLGEAYHIPSYRSCQSQRQRAQRSQLLSIYGGQPFDCPPSIRYDPG